MTPSNIYIIAEAGVNHDGSIDKAKELVEVAASSGADAVKFQTFRAETLVTQQAELADYQRGQGETGNQLEMLKRLELQEQAHLELQALARHHKIDFLSTPFDLASLNFLVQLDLKLFKIASGELTNYPLLAAIAEQQKPVVMSTGMANLDEVRASVSVLVDHGLSAGQITLLQCNTEYPTPFADVNLRAMQTMKREFPHCHIGYSDHSLGIEIPIAAAAMGATIIEKHFTLNKEASGPDHSASLSGDELSKMVQAIRNVELALGNGEKKASPSESKNRTAARKSIVAARPIEAGELFSSQNLTTKRPGSGRSPMDWPDLIGTPATRNYRADEMIE